MFGYSSKKVGFFSVLSLFLAFKNRIEIMSEVVVKKTKEMKRPTIVNNLIVLISVLCIKFFLLAILYYIAHFILFN